MGESRKRYDLITIVFVFLFAIIMEYREAFSLLEDETLSYRQILRTHYADESLTSPSEDIVIVYTDEEFYTEYDKYPLRRTDLSTSQRKDRCFPYGLCRQGQHQTTDRQRLAVPGSHGSNRSKRPKRSYRPYGCRKPR